MILIQLWPKLLKKNIFYIFGQKIFSVWLFWTVPFYFPTSTLWYSIQSIRHHLVQNITIQILMAIPLFGINHGDWNEMHDRLNLEQSDYQILDKVSDLNSKK